MSRKIRAAAGQQYAIVVGLVAVVAIAAVASSGTAIRTLFTKVDSQLVNATNSMGASQGSGAGATGTPPVLYARARLTGFGNKDLVFVQVPSGTDLSTNAAYKARCEAAGFAQNQNSNALSNYTGAGMSSSTSYYCSQHCCYLGSGNSMAGYIANVQNNGLPLNTQMHVYDRGCGDYGGSYMSGIVTSDGLTLTSNTTFTYSGSAYGQPDYSNTNKSSPVNPISGTGLIVCQMP